MPGSSKLDAVGYWVTEETRLLLCCQLKGEARAIYSVYLSEDAPHPVNIDDTAKTEEKDLEEPTPDMFDKAQAQVCAPNDAPMHVRAPNSRCALCSLLDGRYLN